VFRFEIERLASEIAWMSERRVGFVFCADANFGALKRDLELTEAVIASYQRTGFPFSLSVQSTKNATERAYRIQKLLNSSLNAYGVTLALQSVNDSTLEHINRANISSEMYRELQRRFAAEGVYTYTDLILGLPGESYDEFAAGVSEVIAGGQHNHIQFHNCSVLPNAEMGDPDYQARYGMTLAPQVIRNLHDTIEKANWEVEEYIDLVVSTDAMPPEQWRRAKVFAWMVDFAYYDRVLQIPLLVLHGRHGWPVHELIEALIDADPAKAPVIAGLVAALREKAESIQQGGAEYFPIPEARRLLWSGDLRCAISLVLEDRVEDFYREAGELLGAMLADRGHPEDRTLLDETISLNHAALTLPGEREGQLMVLSHNVWEYFKSLIVDSPVELEEGLFFHRTIRSRRWDTIDAWVEHLAEAQGKDKRRYMHPVISPREARPRPAEAVPAA
jgi:hypothetical protein